MGTTLPVYLHPFSKPLAREHFVTVAGARARRLGRRRQRVRRRHGQPLVRQRRLRPGRDRRRRRRADDRAARYHSFDPFTNGPPTRSLSGLRASPRCPTRAGLPRCSGSEAVDSAHEAGPRGAHPGRSPRADARRQPRRGYHGVTYGGTSAQGIPATGRVRPAAPTTFGTSPRRRHRGMGIALRRARATRWPPSSPSRCRAPAACYPPPEGYLTGLRRLCDDHGAFLILDEVICAFGRLGEWFGASTTGSRPTSSRSPRGSPRATCPSAGSCSGRRCTSRWRPTRRSCCATATPTRATRRARPPAWPTSTSSRPRACSTGHVVGARLGAGCAPRGRRLVA